MRFFLLFFLLVNSAWARDFVPNSFRVNFVQSFKSTLTGKEKKSEGTLEYMYPGQFKFEVTSPDQSTFVSDAKTTWLYTPPFDKNEEGEVIIRPGSGPFLPEFFDALKGGLKNNSLFTVEKKDDHYLAVFAKNFAKKINKKETKLFFKVPSPQGLQDLNEMIIVGQDQSEVRLTWTSLDSTPAFNSSYFQFKIPPKTRISK